MKPNKQFGQVWLLLLFRGADIFKDIIQRRVKKEKHKEAKEFKRFKERVERIRQNQAKDISEEPKDYYSCKCYNFIWLYKQSYNFWVCLAIRSGDYYMFESEFESSESDNVSDTEHEFDML